MAGIVGRFNKGNGQSDLAVAEPEPDGNGFKVVVFPEPGSQFDIHHNVPEGTGEGEFSH